MNSYAVTTCADNGVTTTTTIEAARFEFQAGILVLYNGEDGMIGSPVAAFGNWRSIMLKDPAKKEDPDAVATAFFGSGEHLTSFEQTTDAREWARAWIKAARGILAQQELGPSALAALLDDGWMIAWFANAIERGRSAGSTTVTASAATP